MPINQTNLWSQNNYFWKVSISHIIQNHWKILALLWVLQFQFNCGTYSIRQLSSFKLPMDSQCIQVSSSKSISVPNVRIDSHIYIARESASLKKMSKWCFVSQYEYGVLKWLLGFMLSYHSQKVKWYTFAKRFV